MDDIRSPGDLARLYQHRAKKRFGQHFLTDTAILDRICDTIDLNASDRVLEIGPGCGTLTFQMMQRDAEVTAIELDYDAYSFLRKHLEPEGLNLHRGDAMQADLPGLMGEGRFKVAANLPYNVATPLTINLLEADADLGPMALMYQKEVAERICASVGTKAYSSLTLAVWLWADVEMAFTLGPEAFSPPPKVESAVVRFQPIRGSRIADDALRGWFKRVVRGGFGQRRKTLSNALKSALKMPSEAIRESITSAGIDPKIRAERVEPEGFLALARVFADAEERQSQDGEDDGAGK